jgi:hypothetical protein
LVNAFVNNNKVLLSKTNLDEVPVFLSDLEERRGLPNVRIDPDTKLKPSILEALEVPSCVREHFRVEFKITPLVRLHPEAIEVKHPQWEISVFEAVQETSHGFLVVVCGET